MGCLAHRFDQQVRLSKLTSEAVSSHCPTLFDVLQQRSHVVRSMRNYCFSASALRGELLSSRMDCS